MFQDAQRSRRLPVFVIADRSGSMAGEKIVAVNQGMQMLKADLEDEPRAVESVWLSVIGFGGDARVEVPLTELMAFYPPTLDADGGTPLGAALRLLNESIDKEVVVSSGKGTGDYKPLVFLFTDGEPTDEWESAAREVKQRATAQTANIIAVACGQDANVETLRKITESVIKMDEATAGRFKALMKWISQSVKSASVKAVTPTADGGAPTTAVLAPPGAGFTVAF